MDVEDVVAVPDVVPPHLADASQLVFSAVSQFQSNMAASLLRPEEHQNPSLAASPDAETAPGPHFGDYLSLLFLLGILVVAVYLVIHVSLCLAVRMCKRRREASAPRM
jgi:hypothetical protein